MSVRTSGEEIFALEDLRAMAATLPEGSSDFKPEYPSDDPAKNLRHSFAGMATPIQKTATKAVGDRLRQLRFGLAEFAEAPHYKTMRTFADLTETDEDNLSNWERGVSLVPPIYVQRLKEQFGISFVFEWIYGGDKSGLSDRLTTAIFKPPKLAPTIAARTRKRAKG